MLVASNRDRTTIDPVRVRSLSSGQAVWNGRHCLGKEGEKYYVAESAEDDSAFDEGLLSSHAILDILINNTPVAYYYN